MKTSLFNPIFINPLAYFVFPQLYDIIPEYEVLVEPCVFTGTLMVLNSDNTIVRFYTDTKSIDLSEFNNSIVTISLYTDEGATVLGLWVLYGTSAPEEPSFHESLVDAWFMSGITNSDRPQYIKGINETSFYAVDFNVIYGTKENITPTTITLDDAHGYVLNDGPIEEGSTYTIPAYTIEVKTNTINTWIGIGYEDYTGQHFLVETYEDGVFNVPSHTFEYNENMPVWVTCIQTTLEGDDKVTITLRPTIRTKDLVLNNFAFTNESGFNGEGALVFDGIDDYAKCDTMTIMTDYTVIAKRKWITQDKNASRILASKRLAGDKNDGAFTIERSAPTVNQTISFGTINDIGNFKNEDIIWQTKNSYNGTNINSGSLSDTNVLYLASSTGVSWSNVGVYWIAVYDKTLTIDEIEAEKVKLEEEWNKRLIS